MYKNMCYITNNWNKLYLCGSFELLGFLQLVAMPISTEVSTWLYILKFPIADCHLFHCGGAYSSGQVMHFWSFASIYRTTSMYWRRFSRICLARRYSKAVFKSSFINRCWGSLILIRLTSNLSVPHLQHLLVGDLHGITGTRCFTGSKKTYA